MAKTFMRRSRCDKSTLHKIAVILRRGRYRKCTRRAPEIRGRFQHGSNRE